MHGPSHAQAQHAQSVSSIAKNTDHKAYVLWGVHEEAIAHKAGRLRTGPASALSVFHSMHSYLSWLSAQASYMRYKCEKSLAFYY